MTDESATLLKRPAFPLLAAATIIALGVIVGGYLLGDGLRRAYAAESSVTVRGLAERNVTADLAVWTFAYSASAGDLASAQARVDAENTAIRAFVAAQGFPAKDLIPGEVSVSQNTDQAGVVSYTVNQRLILRSNDIARAQSAEHHQADLVRQGVALESGSSMVYSFTKLNDIKPEMVAQATRNARAAAEQFAKDSGTPVGPIKSATQGYFSIGARDGGGTDKDDGDDAAGTPFKKVRVVTTVEFYLR